MSENKGISRLIISPTKGKNEITVSSTYRVLGIKDDGSEMMSFFIPAFNIHYSAPTEEVGRERSKPMVNSFLRFWIEKQGFKKFMSQIIKLGFRADALTTRNLAFGAPVVKKTSLDINIDGLIPEEFKNASSSEQEVETEMAYA